MIKFDTFSAGYRLLCKAFKNDMSDEIADLHYQMLRYSMTDAEFELAVRASIYHEQFFPSPSKLVAHAQGSPDSKAQKAWLAVLKGDCVDKLARDCATELGGPNAIRNTDETKIPWRRDQFISAYKTRLQETATLTLSTGQKHLPAPASDEYDIQDIYRSIGQELIRLDRNGIVPMEWCEKRNIKAQVVSDLNVQQSNDYLDYLRGEDADATA